MWILKRTSKIFDFISSLGKKKKLIKKLDKKEIEAIIDRSTISHNVEQYYIDREKIVVSGWAFSNAKAGKNENSGV